MRIAHIVAVAVVTVASARAQAIGILVPTDPTSQALKLVSHRVEVHVVERGATTHVTQEFENPTGRPLEATYLFPLPKDATVDEFALWMNGTRQTGKVLEKNQARQTYQQIVARTRDPGLVEYVDAQLFEARVFPVPASGRLKVELTFSNLVEYDNGLHRYVYPMKTDQRAATTLEDFTFTVDIESKLAIKNLYSPTHKMAARTKGNRAEASLEKGGFSLADDLALYWSVDDGDVGVTMLSYKDGDEPGYFMALASPKDGLRNSEIIGKRVAFVVDTSGSMEGEKMAAVQKSLDECLGKLGEDDLFSLVSFGGYAEAWKEKMVAANRSNIDAARGWVKKLEPLGGTNIDEALQTAFATATGSDKAPLIVVLLTDGRPTVGETDATKLLAKVQSEREAKNARVFVLGVGDDLNPALLDKLSSGNGGSALYLKGTSALEGEVASFYEKISHPVLTDLKLQIDGVETFGMQPRALGDLFAGEQLVVIGRYRTPGKAHVTLTGSTPKGTRTFSADAVFADRATQHAFIPRLWAQRQVGMMLDEIRAKGESPGLVAEVTQLATRFGIVTPYTSYLVVEPAAAPIVADRVRMDAPPPPATAMAPEPARDGAGFFMADKKPAMHEESGDAAVSVAKEIGKLKKADTVSKTRALTSTMHALGRTFTFKDGAFVDEACKPGDAVLEIKPYSDAFFAALKLRPDLKDAMVLAESVKIHVAAGKTLSISAHGAESADVAAFLR